ncbi:MAG: hypothetical protein MJ182_00045 [Treponema sp.]|nr:hypothetical protein [Treponema sp.]
MKGALQIPYYYMKKVILFILSGLLLFPLFSRGKKDDFVSEKAKYDIRIENLILVSMF